MCSACHIWSINIDLSECHKIEEFFLPLHRVNIYNYTLLEKVKTTYYILQQSQRQQQVNYRT